MIIILSLAPELIILFSNPIFCLNFSIPDLPIGQHAVSVYQDSNDNGKLDALIFGIPKEKHGFSNDIRLPNYEKCFFKFNDNTTINIQIK
jgi:uncharacterized protein (DUF2141 family)